jgi:hypothetical protein
MGKWLRVNELREGLEFVFKDASNEEGEFTGKNSMECLSSQYLFMGGTVRMGWAA